MSLEVYRSDARGCNEVATLHDFLVNATKRGASLARKRGWFGAWAFASSEKLRRRSKRFDVSFHGQTQPLDKNQK
jgi:hypothetical protein